MQRFLLTKMVAANVTRLAVECGSDGSPMLTMGLQIPLSLLIPAVAEFQRSLGLPVAPFGGSDGEMNAGLYSKDAALNVTIGGVPGSVRGAPGLTSHRGGVLGAVVGAAGEHRSKTKSSKPKPRAHELASAGQAEELKEELQKVPEMLNMAVGDNGVTPLLLAALKGRTEAVRTLIEARADVNKAGLDKHPGDGASPAFWCAHKGHTESLALLIQAKADIMKPNGHGATPVFAAAQKGCTNAARLLLEAGADVDKARDDGVTPALIAASEDHVDLLNLLVAHRADLNQCSYDGVTPVCIATQKNFINSVQALLDSGADVNKATIHGATPAYIAAWMGHTDILQALIAAGANFDRARSDDGTSPIFIAILEGHAEAVYVLATAKADLFSTSRGRTTLQEAIKRGRGNVAAVLSCAMGLHGLSLPAGEDPKTAVAKAVRAYRAQTPPDEWPPNMQFTEITGAQVGQVGQAGAQVGAQVGVQGVAPVGVNAPPGFPRATGFPSSSQAHAPQDGSTAGMNPRYQL